MDHDQIVKDAAERIMQRVNDTYPRTLNIDVLTDEIGRAIKEATKRTVNWPPPVAFASASELLRVLQVDKAITASHDKARAKLPLPE